MSNLQRKPIKPHFPSKWAAILILVTFVDELEFEEQFGWIDCNWENKTLVKYNTIQRVFGITFIRYTQRPKIGKAAHLEGKCGFIGFLCKFDMFYLHKIHIENTFIHIHTYLYV
jgi:hypothetical protein